MTDPIASKMNIPPLPPALPGGPAAAPADGASQADFVGLLKGQLTQVSEIQKDADEQVQRLVAGETENMSEVFVAARKAQVAFSLLMEMRNKLVDAYEEVRNMRV